MIDQNPPALYDELKATIETEAHEGHTDEYADGCALCAIEELQATECMRGK